MLFWLQPGYSLRTFTGHSATVMSLDFHPSKEDLICSCDGDGEMRYWSINNGNCAGVFKSVDSVQSLEIWDMNENKTMTLPAHDGLIAALAVSNVTGVVASASHDKCVKLWK
ncbi:hypothetical protein BHE74_00025774 [Ensete ventricosum]|uniref:Uncharacterized protein n=1 Tax=Ensete ventricosum TaxID=4639 RepID=A0A427AMC5_ENSVE|nr:hypothetical protein B296_00021771 [Ensete ventricosum]RWW09305.1 hypothetical protein GW17_00027211 [Ensete ventricosum]RWW66823.1 hypothetical protein BHE74_00025774 [Ensete ventricosum]RZS03750.1 hypothetical protein BHM03_00033955 [Ensete ventricosum]